MCFWAAVWAWANYKIFQPSMRGLAVCKVLLKPGFWNVLSSLSPFSCLLLLFLSAFPLSLNSPLHLFFSSSLPPLIPIPLLSFSSFSLLPPHLCLALWNEIMQVAVQTPTNLNILWLPLRSVSVLVGSSRCAIRAYPKLHAFLYLLAATPFQPPSSLLCSDFLPELLASSLVCTSHAYPLE